MLHITFETAHKAGACQDSYRNLAKTLGGITKYGKSTQISLLQVLEHNGLPDTMWALRCVLPEESEYRDKLARIFACDCAERVLYLFEGKYPEDKHPRQAIETARRYANGKATQEELAAARAAARAAGEVAWAAARAAGEVAWAAGEVAWAAARAAGEVAGEVAWAAARAAGEVAGEAAWATAWAAGEVAGEAAWATELDWQKQHLAELLKEGRD